MEIVILSPNAKMLFSPGQMRAMKSLAQLRVESVIKPLSKLTGLDSDSPKILAIDPDYCHWQFKKQDLDRIGGLRAVVLQTTSFSWFDTAYAKDRGIPVINLKGFSTVSVAEWATTTALNLARRTPVLIKDGWKQDYLRHQGIELRGRTAGIIGMGQIGRAIAENCLGLGMKVQYWSRISRDKRFRRVTLENLFKNCDVVFPALAKNSETAELITDRLLRSLKRSCIFVSIVPTIYNHELLLKLVGQKRIFGYGFEENNPDFNKYRGNVWAGAELAWCTEDSFKKNSQQWLRSIIRAVKGRYPNRVN